MVVKCRACELLVGEAVMSKWGDWRLWCRIRKKYPVKTKHDKQWLTGSKMDTSSTHAKLLAQGPVRVNFSSAGLQILPVINWPSFSSSGDAQEGFVVVPFYLVVAIRNLAIFMFLRPIEVPWSELKPVAEDKDLVILEFDAERYRLELSSQVSKQMQHYSARQS
jgi:hypothetical protein